MTADIAYRIVAIKNVMDPLIKAVPKQDLGGVTCFGHYFNDVLEDALTKQNGYDYLQTQVIEGFKTTVNFCQEYPQCEQQVRDIKMLYTQYFY